MVASGQFDVLVLHHPDDAEVAERIERELRSVGTSADLEAFSGSLADIPLDEGAARAIVVVVGPDAEPAVRSSIDVLARHARAYLVFLPKPRPYDLRGFPPDRTFELERLDDLIRRLLEDLELDTEPTSSNAPATKATAPPSDEESGPAEPLDRDIFEQLTPSSQSALAHAERLARLGKASRIHMDHLLVGLYRKPDGPTQRLFADAKVTTEELEEILEGIVEPIVPDTPPEVHDLESPPAVSRHVKLAFEAARDVAARTRAEAQAQADSPAQAQVQSKAQVQAPIADGRMPWIQSRHVLYGLLSVERCTLVKALKGRGIDKTKIELGAPIEPDIPIDVVPPTDDESPIDLNAVIAGFRSDEARGPDLLDIRREVDALGKVIAAVDVKPPLAIGLFGDWGTGKTFFMKRLQRRIRTIAKAESDRAKGTPVYCKEIVQLEFNAWHYIEENLWASLAAAIFDGLDASLTRRDQDPAKLLEDESSRAKVLTDRAAAQQDLQTAEQAKAEADRHVQATETRLTTLADGSASATDIVAGAWTAAMSDSTTKATADEATATIRKAAEDLKLDPEVITRDLRRGGSIGSRVMIALRSWVKGWGIWLPIAAVALAIVVAIAVLVPVLAGPALGVGGLAVLGALGTISVYARRAWGVLGTARKQYLYIIDRDRKALELERTDALGRAAKAQGEIDAARKQLLEAEATLENLRPSRQLANFVSGRHSSGDYRGRLGVVAQARDDFEQLSQLILKARTAGDGQDGDGQFLPSVDRIILYIDDLDRCREKEVVDVLQAVHLLLAFELFVVVVAVDPRWLVHSLRVQSRVLQGQGDATRSTNGQVDEDEALEWQSTPLNYLEKIFQVPFAIRPMGKTGFEKMIADLVGPVEAGTIPGSTMTELGGNGTGTSTPGPGGGADTGAVVVATDGGSTNGGSTNGGPAVTAGGTTTQTTTPAKPKTQSTPDDADEESEDLQPVDMDPGFLEIANPEREFMALLHSLVATPRAAKRFVNVYRILKASVVPERRPKLDEEADHRAVLLLLAMLTSHPTETTAILQALVDEKAGTGWWSFVKTVRDEERAKERARDRARDRPAVDRPQSPASDQQPPPDAEEPDDGWTALVEKLDTIEPHWREAQVPPFAEWARDVSRFSFESSRVLLTPVPEPPRVEDRQTVRA